MAWGDPVNSAGLCFFSSGVPAGLFFPCGWTDVSTPLVPVIESGDALILWVESFFGRSPAWTLRCHSFVFNGGR